MCFRLLSAIVLASALLLCGGLRRTAAQGPATNSADAPEYTQDGKLRFPAQYREWIYLTTGFDMSYNPRTQMPGHSMFDNVFVNPSAYREFLKTGTWPEKTMLVLEPRMAGSNASIIKAGHFQTGEIMGFEIHVKDSRFQGGWAFFGYDEGEKEATMITTSMPCYSCHQQHGAVDTTFVQFYPTLIKIAEQKGTLSEAYKKEQAAK